MNKRVGSLELGVRRLKKAQRSTLNAQRFLLFLLLSLNSQLSTLNFLQAAFLNFGGGARNAAMGNALVSGGSEVFAMQTNPSLLTQMKNAQLGFEYQKLFTGLSDPETNVPGFRSVDLNVSNVSFGIPFRKLIGSFGLSYLRFASPGLYQEETIQLTMARNLNDLILRGSDESLGLGIGLKFLRRSVEADDFSRATLNASGNSASATTLDLGSTYEPIPDLSIGLSLRNLISADVGIVKEDRVSKEIVGGVAWSGSIEDFPAKTVITAALSRREGEQRTNFHAGIEAAFSTLSPRLGVNRDEFSAGFGLEFKQVMQRSFFLDYAFIFPLNLSGTTGTHRIAIRIGFGPSTSTGGSGSRKKE